jgi:arsenite transporter
VWNDLAGGNGDYCAILVAFNSILQMVLYAPFAIFYINVVSPHQSQFSPVTVSYSIVAKSVAVFLGIPLAAAITTRLILLRILTPQTYTKRFIRYIAPLSLIGLLFTIIILFASQGRNVVNQIILVVRVAAPLVVYFAIIFLSTLWICRRLGMEYGFASVQSFTAASNNFELAIAVAIATFGANSNQALAATVGPLIEVPVLLGLVYLMRWLRTRWSWGRRGEEEGLEPVEVLGVRDVEKVGEGGGNALQAARTVE